MTSLYKRNELVPPVHIKTYRHPRREQQLPPLTLDLTPITGPAVDEPVVPRNPDVEMSYQELITRSSLAAIGSTLPTPANRLERAAG